MQPSVETTPWFGKETVIALLLPMTLVLQSGTGGNTTAQYHRLRRVQNTVPAYVNPANYEADVAPSTDVANEVKRVLDVLKLPVTELAKYFGVSRTAVYDWRNGKQIGTANAAKLANFAKAADVIAGANLQMSPLVRNRKLSGGKTLLELIATGADGEASASALIRMLQDEASRREKLAAQFSSRIKSDTEGTNDAPAVFNE